VLVVSNPVDILTYLAEQELGLPQGRSSGWAPCSTRSGSAACWRLNLEGSGHTGLGDYSRRAWRQHGADLVECQHRWAAAGKVSGLHPETWRKTPSPGPRHPGAEMIKKKTGAGFAVGVSIAEVIHAIALDSKRVLPVSTVQRGCYGLRDVALSVPTVVGRAGAEQTP
jgi:L-lactate dehydrogenase